MNSTTSRLASSRWTATGRRAVPGIPGHVRGGERVGYYEVEVNKRLVRMAIR